MLLLVDVVEVFKNVCQQNNVCPDIEVVIVTQRLASERVPNFVRVRDIYVRDLLSGEIAEEFFFGNEVHFFELLL